ncbi:universal stress protein [uncultured Pseudokineococcus sp.]|uniref:universal stress protein n=1 Tax=uncultured Pseudokineococcus sp. TaxID=1642928 RepID=UPI0026094545|nr:universal stress protein [uncultured Pseudokineococcus sp.]
MVDVAVLVGWSGTVEGAAALERGAAEALLRGLPLAVVDLSTRDDGGEAARRAVAALEPAPASAQVLRRPEHQDPVDALLDAVPGAGAELLVVGTRRRSPVGKFLMGSTAQRIILGSDVPVLVVKAGREG